MKRVKTSTGLPTSLDWKATLTPVAGQELVNGTIVYKIEIDVQDLAGNPLETTITFVTRPE